VLTQLGPFRILSRISKGGMGETFVETTGVWWMALELVDGIGLRALLSERRASRERLPVEAVLFIAAELAKALSYARSVRLADGRVGICPRRCAIISRSAASSS
jgi:hypothetical protein